MTIAICGTRTPYTVAENVLVEPTMTVQVFSQGTRATLLAPWTH